MAQAWCSWYDAIAAAAAADDDEDDDCCVTEKQHEMHFAHIYIHTVVNDDCEQ